MGANRARQPAGRGDGSHRGRARTESRRGCRRRLHQRHPGTRLQDQQLHRRPLCVVPLEEPGPPPLQDDGVHEQLHVRRQSAQRPAREPGDDARRQSLLHHPLSGPFLDQVPARSLSLRYPDLARDHGGHRLRRRQPDIRARRQAPGHARPRHYAPGLHRRQADHAHRHQHVPDEFRRHLRGQGSPIRVSSSRSR